MNRSKIQDYKDGALQSAETLADNARRAAYEVADTTRGLADKVGNWAETRTQDVVAAIDEGSARTRQFVSNRPLLSLAVVVGVSALVAYWFTRRSMDSGSSY